MMRRALYILYPCEYSSLGESISLILLRRWSQLEVEWLMTPRDLLADHTCLDLLYVATFDYVGETVRTHTRAGTYTVHSFMRFDRHLCVFISVPLGRCVCLDGCMCVIISVHKQFTKQIVQAHSHICMYTDSFVYKCNDISKHTNKRKHWVLYLTIYV